MVSELGSVSVLRSVSVLGSVLVFDVSDMVSVGVSFVVSVGVRCQFYGRCWCKC